MFDLEAWLTGTCFIHISRCPAWATVRDEKFNHAKKVSACLWRSVKDRMLLQTAEGNTYRREVFPVQSEVTRSLSQ